MVNKSQQFNFIVYAKPKAKERPRFSNGRVYTPKNTKDFENLIKLEAAKYFKTPLTGPISCSILFYSANKNKKLDGKFKTTRPDLDNMGKAVLDALNGIAYIDDGQVAVLTMQKRYYHRDAINVVISQLIDEPESPLQTTCQSH